MALLVKGLRRSLGASRTLRDARSLIPQSGTPKAPLTSLCSVVSFGDSYTGIQTGPDRAADDSDDGKQISPRFNHHPGPLSPYLVPRPPSIDASKCPGSPLPFGRFPGPGGTVSGKGEASLCSRNQPPGGLGSAILQIGKETLLAVVREAEQDREFITNGDVSIAGLHRI